MEEKDVSYLSVEEVDRQQIEISLITGVLGVLGGIIAALLGGGLPVFTGAVCGTATGIAFHWWLYHDLKTAISLTSASAGRYANVHSILRITALVIVLILFMLNRWIEINALSMFAGLIIIKPVVYVYNIRKAGKTPAEKNNEH